MGTTNYRDPNCTSQKPGHICRRSDGAKLTGDNGECFDTTSAQATSGAQ